MKNELKKVKFVQMRSSGATYQEISDELEVSKPTLINWSKNQKHEIHNAIEIHKEALLTEFRLDYKRQLELKSKFLNRIEEEINSLDFSKTSPEKLLRTALELIENLQSRPRFSSDGDMPKMFEDTEWSG